MWTANCWGWHESGPQAMSTPIKLQLLRRLVAAGTWQRREVLAHRLETSPMAKLLVEEALADLLVEGKAVYRADVGYRLSGTALCRQAAKEMQEKKLARAVRSKQVGQEYLVGVAQAHQTLGMVMYELAMPMPAAGPDFIAQHMKQVNAVVDLTTGAR